MGIGARFGTVPTIVLREVRLLHQFSVPEITFLGEQDGPAERRLKEALAVLLRLDATVTKAYLARVIYAGKTSGVMLGLLTNDQEESPKLAEQLGKAFAALFNTDDHLDIVFLSDELDAEISHTCAPFYQRNSGYH